MCRKTGQNSILHDPTGPGQPVVELLSIHNGR